MKKQICLLVTFIFLAVASPAIVNAKDKKPSTELTVQQKARLTQIEKRVEEINNIDRTSLTHDQKQDLKKELRSMRKELRAAASGGNGFMAYLIVILGLLLVVMLLY